MTTRQHIRQWFEFGVSHAHTHMIVVCDTFSWEDYPVYVETDQIAQLVYEQYSQNMQKVMEIYDLHDDMESQLKEKKAWSI